MRKLVIFGVRAFAKIAHFYFERDSDYRVVAFCVDGEYLTEPRFRGIPVVAFEEIEGRFPPDDHDMFVAVGHQKTNTQRQAKVAAAQERGYRLASLVSPKAYVADDLSVGPNSIVMEYAVLQPFVKVGHDSIIWSATGMGFQTEVGDHCWIVSARFGESVVVGDNTFVGLNATIGPKVRIGKANVIGAGALILKDTKDYEVYRGQASRPASVPSYRLPSF